MNTSLINNRYSRQTLLPEVGEHGQHRLNNSSVLIIGAGGLGSPAAAYLAGSGMGKITVVDHDTIAEHNLHRQVFYREQHIGEYKAKVLADYLKGLNSDITINAIKARLLSSNVEQLVNKHDIILDCADNFATTYLLNDTCQAHNKYLISASIIGTKGYLGIFCKTAPSYRAVFPTPPEFAGNCASNGVFGPAVGSLALMQAQQVIMLLLESENALIGKLLNTDFWQSRFTTMDFNSAPEPTAFKTIGIVAREEITDSDLLIDCRSDEEQQNAPVKNSVSVRKLPEDISRYKRLVYFCVSGNRAYQQATEKDIKTIKSTFVCSEDIATELF